MSDQHRSTGEPGDRTTRSAGARLASPSVLTAVYLAVLIGYGLVRLLWHDAAGPDEAVVTGVMAADWIFMLASGALVYFLTAQARSAGTSRGANESIIETPPGIESAASAVIGHARAIVDQLGDPGYLLDREGRFLHVNPALAAMTGHSASTLVGQPYEPLVADMDIDRVRAHFEAAFSGVTQSYVAHGRKPDGNPYAVQVLNIPWRSPNGIDSVIGIARDVTEELKRPGRLTDSEVRYRAVFEHTPYAMVVTDPVEGSVLDANEGAEQLLGLGRKELMERRRADLLDASDERVRRFFAERKAHSVARGDLPVRRGDGVVITAEVTSVLYRDPGGRPRAIFIARDLSAEHAREHQYQSLFEHSLDGILLATPDGEVEAANPAALELFGMSLDQLKRRGRKGVVAPNDAGMEKLLAERNRTGSGRAVVRYFRADGTVFPAEASSSLFRNAAGELRTTVIFRDISERIRREELLAESEAQLRAIFDHSMDALVVGDPDTGGLLACNQAAESLFGITEAELRKL